MSGELGGSAGQLAGVSVGIPACVLQRRHRFNADGIVIVEYGLEAGDLSALDQVAARWRPRSGGLIVLGDDLEFVARHTGLQVLACGLIQEPIKLIRVVSCTITASDNWFVPWQQELLRLLAGNRESSDAVSCQHSPAGSLERGMRDPVAFEPEVPCRMVSLRIFLDDCGEDDGPLEVALGSHRFGPLRGACSKTGVCLARRGDIVAMSPLLLHRSQRARAPSGARRMLHLEYVARACGVGH